MRLDAALAALFLSGLTGVQSFNFDSSSWNATNWNSTDNSTSNRQLISQLHKEIQELREKLADAGSACASGSGSSNGGSGGVNTGAASASVTGHISGSPASISPATTSSAAAGNDQGSWGSGPAPGSSLDVSTYLTTITNQYTTAVSTLYLTKTVYATRPGSSASLAAPNNGGGSSPVVSNAGDSSSSPSSGPAGSNGASNSPSSNGGWNGGSAAGTTSNPGDYYALQPIHVTSTATSTTTIIVTVGQTVTSASSVPGVDTCTETYVGTATVPTQDVSSSSTSSVSTTARNSLSSSAPYGFGNGTSSGYPTGSAASSGFASKSASASAASSGFISNYATGTAVTRSAVTGIVGTSVSSSSSSSASASATAAANLTDCSSFCSTLTKLNDWDVTVETCTQLKAGNLVNTPSGQSSVGCAASFTPAIDICQVTLNVKTAGSANTYMEVWLPNGNASSWNGRTMSTDNGGLNGCVHYVDMQYVSGMGFASIGDNAGHNGSSFDGTWTINNNEAIVDWAWRARHASVDIGKQVVNQFYNKKPEKSYYIGCSAGGAQGLQSAQKFPNDFDGIISGSSANDFNHLQDWSAHFRQLTGASGNDTFLSLADWTLVQSYILQQCDEPLDGVADGILEDPTLCDAVFDITAIPVCNDTITSGCLTATQIDTVEQAFKPLYNGNSLIYPALLYGAQVDAFKLGLLSGSIQGIAQDFFRGAVYNDSSFSILNIAPKDWDRADQLDDLHGNPSAFNGDLSGFQAAGKKLMMYHGMADPMTSGTNSQRYYQKVAATMGLGNTEIDNFMRFFRISGMAHCGVGGISGAGPWMFGQSLAAAPATDNIVSNLVDWVEKGAAPESLLGTKFWYDTPSMGIEFQRRHCRYPYRTTYKGGDSTKPDSWGCDFIANWQDCEGVTCNADGTFT